MRDGAALPALVRSCDDSELVALAIQQGVAGRAAERLSQELGEDQRARLAERVRMDALRHMSNLARLQRVGAVLDAAGVTWASLKGPVLAELSYGTTVRGYSDLDILVTSHDLRKAIEALREDGAELAEDDWRELISQGKGELVMSLDGVPVLDLHWHLVSDGPSRHRYRVPSDEVVERRRRVLLGGLETWTLEQTDFAIHVALHATYSGAHKLRWLLDVERTVANQTPDWPLLAERCRQWRVHLPVGLALSRARRNLGADVPPAVIEALARTKAEQLLVDFLTGWAPAGTMPGGRSFKNALARSLRDGVVPSGAQFSSEIWGTLRDVLRPTRPRSHGPAADDGREGPRTADLARYLDMVESADRVGHLRVGN